MLLSWLTKSKCIMKRHLSILGAVISFGMLAVPTYAADNVSLIYIGPHAADTITPYYIRGNIGASMFNDITPKNPVTQTQQGTVKAKGGSAFQIAFGRNFDGYRFDLEAGRQSTTTDQIGTVEVLSILVNGYYDLPIEEIPLYLTAGIGSAGVTVTNYVSSSVLGYQFGAGVVIPLSDVMAIDARYRYFGTGKVSYTDNSSEVKIAGSSFLIGLKIGMK